MASVQGAASGAQTGAQIGSFIPGVGTAIGAVVGAVVGGLAGSSGKEDSVLQGFIVDGSFGRNGFQGTITAGDQQGNRWNATGEQTYANSLGRKIVQLAPDRTISDAQIDRYFNQGGAPIPVRLNHGADNSNLVVEISDYIAAQLKGGLASSDLLSQITNTVTTMQAPADIFSTAPAPGTPSATTNAAQPVTSLMSDGTANALAAQQAASQNAAALSGAPAVIQGAASAAGAWLSNPNMLLVLAAVGALWYFSKKG